jgi:hypothetical protein
MEKKDSIATIQELLKGCDADFDSTSQNEIKMIRHADKRTSGVDSQSDKLLIAGKPFPKNITTVHALYDYRRELFDQYQREQLRKNFKGIKYLVVFLGEQGTTAKFVGVYKICGQSDSPYAENEVVLDLVHLDAFNELEETVIIDWGKGTLQWCQYYSKEKPVIRRVAKTQKNDLIPPFKSYLETILNYAELALIIDCPEWVEQLKKKNCVYAILDTYTGKIYIGSTYNPQGIYGRWIDYARNGHGDNKDLEATILKDPNYAKNHFQWTILELLEINISQKEAIDRETLWKQKLKTNQFGYNNN